MYDELIARIGLVSGPASFGMGYSFLKFPAFDQIIEKTTPAIAWLAMVIGGVASLLASIYYIKKIFFKK